MQIVTLSTDIGHHDYLTGAVKGQLLSQNAGLNITDITHYLSQSNFPQAAYVCANAFKHFPSKTIHIILLNLFGNSSKQILIANHQEQFIVCPDNGILTMITENTPAEIISINIQSKNTLLEITETIAAAVGKLSSGMKLNDVGDVAVNITDGVSG